MAIATLSIDIIAKLGELQRGMAEAGNLSAKTAKTIEGSFGKLDAMIKGLGATLAGAFAAKYGFEALRAQSIEAMLAIKDLAEATGSSIENVSALENVMRNAGGTLGDAGDVLVKFNNALRGTGDDAEQTGRVSQVLEKLGLSAERLKAIDPAQALREVALAFAQFDDDGAKARNQAELFGKSIKMAGPLLKELAEQQQFAGSVTADQVEQADRLNKQLAQLQRNSQDTGRAIGEWLVPTINQMFREVKAGKEAFGSFWEWFKAPVGWGNDGNPMEMLRKYNAELAALSSTQSKLRPGFDDEERASLGEQIVQIQRFITYYTKLAGLTGNAGGGRGFVNPRLSVGDLPGAPAKTPAVPKASEAERYLLQLQKELEKTQQLSVEQQLLTDIENKRIDGLTPKLQAELVLAARKVDAARALNDEKEREAAFLKLIADKEQRDVNEVIGLLEQTSSAKLDSLTRQGDALMAFSRNLPENDPRQRQVLQAMTELNKQAKELTASLSEPGVEIKKLAEDVDEFSKQAARNIQDALGETLTRVLAGDFSNIGQLWLQTLQKMAAEAAAAQLNKALFGDLFSGGSAGPWGAAIGDFFKSTFGGMFASGGTLGAGRWGIAGERGPELVTGPATIVPGRAMGSSFSYSPTIVVQGDVGPATVALVERMLQRDRARASRRQYAGAAA